MPSKKQEKITNEDLLVLINDSFTGLEGRFEGIDKRFDGIDKRFDGIDKRFDGIDKRFEGIDKRFDKIEATMVTKDYLDDKLCDLRDDLTRLMFKGDVKLKSLVSTLHRRKVIPLSEKKRLFEMEPFSQLRQS